MRALASAGPGSQVARRLALVERLDSGDWCLLYSVNAGALQLSVLAPEDSSLPALRKACDAALGALAQI